MQSLSTITTIFTVCVASLADTYLEVTSESLVVSPQAPPTVEYYGSAASSVQAFLRLFIVTAFFTLRYGLESERIRKPQSVCCLG